MSADCVPILVLRHGQSEWKSIRRWQGTADSPLTELGRQHAGATARLLAALRLQVPAVWTSDLRRASVIDYRSLPALIEQRVLDAGLPSAVPSAVSAEPPAESPGAAPAVEVPPAVPVAP